MHDVDLFPIGHQGLAWHLLPGLLIPARIEPERQLFRESLERDLCLDTPPKRLQVLLLQNELLCL